MTETKFSDETGRLAALHRYEMLDGDDAAFGTITELVRLSLDVPMAAVTLIDRDRQTATSPRGLTREAIPSGLGLCAHAIRHAGPLVIADTLADPRFADDPMVAGAPGVRSYLGAPLTTPDGYNVGALCAFDVRPRRFDVTKRAIIEHLARLVMDRLELRQAANSDGLTGALSRGGFGLEVEKELARARRYARPSALLLVDVDYFRRINDRHGQEVGDAVLAGLVERCRSGLRRVDLIGRMGGDEFAILLPETGGEAAMDCARRLCAVVADTPMRVSGQTLPVTASFGVAALSDEICTAQQWFAEADIALYEAKTYGRNRVVMAHPERIAHRLSDAETPLAAPRMN